MYPPGDNGAEQVTLNFPHNSNVSEAEWAVKPPTPKAAKRKNEVVQGGASGQYSIYRNSVGRVNTPAQQ